MPLKKHKAPSPLSNLLEKINAVCVLCSESIDTQHLFKDALQSTLPVFKARRGAIFLLDPQTHQMLLKASVGLKDNDQEELLKTLGPGKGYRSKTAIASPLMIKDKLTGSVHIYAKNPPKPFTHREHQLLDFLSNQIALNYQRIVMAHQLGHAREETSGLKKQIESQERLVSLGKLAGGIAHEFNNPLDGVMRYNHLCMSHAQNDEVLKEYLTEVQMGLKRMANIVKNLLACARQSPESARKADIHKTIEGALKELYPYLAAKNIKLVKHFAHNVPEITDWGLERVFSNLIKNAIDAIDKNGCIEIRTLTEDGFIKIAITDTGHGITAADLDKIFEPFFTTKDIDKGCGLGLTVVNEIVKLYNGKIKVKSRLKEGTTFSIKLPLAEAP